MKNFCEKISEIGTTEWTISESRGLPVLSQTPRNQARNELMLALCAHMQEYLEGVATVDMTAEGVAIQVENPTVGELVEEGNGFITMILDLSFKDLLFDGMFENEAYLEAMAQKQAKAQARAIEKERKAAEAKAKRTSKNK